MADIWVGGQPACTGRHIGLCPAWAWHCGAKISEKIGELLALGTAVPGRAMGQWCTGQEDWLPLPSSLLRWHFVQGYWNVP